jgi:hypothetical protein
VKQTIAQTIAKSIRAEKRKTIVQMKFQSQFMQNFQRHYPGVIDSQAQANGYKKALSKKKSTIDSEKSSINLPMKTSFVLGTQAASVFPLHRLQTGQPEHQLDHPLLPPRRPSLFQSQIAQAAMFSLNSCCSSALDGGLSSCPDSQKLAAKLDHVIQLLTGNKPVTTESEVSPQ